MSTRRAYSVCAFVEHLFVYLVHNANFEQVALGRILKEGAVSVADLATVLLVLATFGADAAGCIQWKRHSARFLVEYIS